MGDRYAVGLTQTDITTSTTGADAAGSLESVATVRPRIYDLIFSHGGTPADNVIRWIVPRMTASNTSNSSVAENALDPGAPAADAIALEEYTGAPTVTTDSEVLDFALNQRATFRWVAAPGGELVLPATTTDGFFFNASVASGSPGSARVTCHWEE